MNNENFNPIIKTIQSLRKIVMDIKTSNIEIEEHDKNIKKQIEEAGKLIVSSNDSAVSTIWINEKTILIENSNKLLGILKEIEIKLKNKDTSHISELWNDHNSYKEIVLQNLKEMSKIGELIFTDGKVTQWNSIWYEINKTVKKILSISETYSLKLSTIENLKPEEIDELTMDIMKYIPWTYSDEEAYNYEKDYLIAYEEIKAIQSKKKNLWDKILDVLAGGIQETPSHRVQMKRWMEGNSVL